ncbi:rab9 effector protein with kelch motifs isoform X1 [Apus apus]|uniref:rab9 effector protein with kelch motifs isoform X1 n=1 Tax=Apus apus TaxID=8895 RepID=UPI0021F8F8FB|nr:rab9 effector protein with kelch motifs isoform X1 [Apus apus]
MGPRPLPLLEPGGRPGRGKWYRLSPRGDRPRGRVGHGCLFLPGGGTGRVLLVGGADPAGAFADAHFVELGALRWAAAGWAGLRPRYEHATFLPAGPARLWVFGGAHPAGNRSCVQALDPEIGTWESPEVGGEQPLPRTFHSSSAAVGDCLYVFGGGHRGAEPVQDQQLHVFDTATLTWSQPDTRGDPPSPRQGHVVAAVGTKLFIHGGLAGDVFYDDLFCIDTTDRRWVKIPATGEVPGGRASHSSAVFREHLYIFGGIGPEGALSTTYKYHTVCTFALQRSSSGHSCSLTPLSLLGGWITPCVSFPGGLGRVETRELSPGKRKLGKSQVCQQVTQLCPSRGGKSRGAVLRTQSCTCCLCLGGWTPRDRCTRTAWSA